MKYKSECPECGNVDILNKAETKKKVHCQSCYHHYDFKPKYTLGELVKGITEENRHEEIITDRQGNELI